MNTDELNQTIFIADNLGILRGLDSESVDLIATDPPYNKNEQAFNGTGAAAGASFKDAWSWDDDVQGTWTKDIQESHPNLYAVIHAAGVSYSEDMAAFLCWLGVRVLEMHRVLKPTGSIYLQCDSTAAAYIKAMMDAIFGKDNFRNEIAWCYSGGGVPQKAFARKHETILFYCKSDDAPFNRQFAPYSESSARMGRGYLGQELDVTRGKAMDDWWDDVKPIAGIRKTIPESTGWPTQKPIDLYTRIIEASSNPGDLVLDPFAGSGTTCVAAERTGRRWIGIDIDPATESVTLERLQLEVRASMAWRSAVKVWAIPPTRTDDGEPAAPELITLGVGRGAIKMALMETKEDLHWESGYDEIRCWGCGKIYDFFDELDLDHLIPKKAGGSDDRENRSLLCPPCNRLKRQKFTINEIRKVRLDEGRGDCEWVRARYDESMERIEKARWQTH